MPELAEFYAADSPGSKGSAEIAVTNRGHGLLAKARFYVRHDSERAAACRRAYARTLEEHTWFRRFGELFPKMGWQLPAPPRILPSQL